MAAQQASDRAPSAADQKLFPGFRPARLRTADDVEIAFLVGGSGPPLLLLHGHPQTHVIWHRVALTLARSFTVVIADLRGYGDSSKPPGAADHVNYAKRAMAADMIAVMAGLGFERFDIMAHDRGARVAHRLAMDRPAAVRRLVLLDIAPTLAMYEQTGEDFARAYWHWFFLIQKSPLPERLIEADPAAYVTDLMGGRSSGLAPFDQRWPSISDAWLCPDPPTASVRTIARPPASTSSTTAPIGRPDGGWRHHCWSCGAPTVWWKGVSTYLPSGAESPTMSAAGPCAAVITSRRKHPTNC